MAVDNDAHDSSDRSVTGRCTRSWPVVRLLAMVGMAIALSGCLTFDVMVLSSDGTQGRDNNSPGGVWSRGYLVDRLDDFAEPLGTGTSGVDAYLQPYSTDRGSGANILAVIPGTDLADEYVMVGAHYDGTGIGGCAPNPADPSDDICNGATDNAAGVAIVVDIGRSIAAAEVAPSRSVILALWDGEEDGLVGSTHYVNNPVVPNADVVTYVNYDIQGSNLTPMLRTTTLAIGAETGGPSLQAVVDNAAADGPLQTSQLSSLFGQLRSDYAPFIAASVPTVFFTDSTGPCYETVQDDYAAVDIDKLEHQADMGYRLTADLASGAGPADGFVAGNPAATYSDAVEMLALVNRAEADLEMFAAGNQALLLSFRDQLRAMVEDGADEFSAGDVNRLLGGSALLVTILSSGPCDPFLAEMSDL